MTEFLFDLDKTSRRREFLQSFADAPIPVLHLLLAAHAKDQLLMKPDSHTQVDDELERRSEFYHAEWLYDATDRYLQEEAINTANTMQAAANVFAIQGDEEY